MVVTWEDQSVLELKQILTPSEKEFKPNSIDITLNDNILEDATPLSMINEISKLSVDAPAGYVIEQEGAVVVEENATETGVSHVLKKPKEDEGSDSDKEEVTV